MRKNCQKRILQLWPNVEHSWLRGFNDKSGSGNNIASRKPSYVLPGGCTRTYWAAVDATWSQFWLMAGELLVQGTTCTIQYTSPISTLSRLQTGDGMQNKHISGPEPFDIVPKTNQPK